MIKLANLELKISSYHAQFKADFIALNLEWLEHFFYVEAHDKAVLNQCEKYILDPGGHIFFFLLDDIVVGTYALMKIDNAIFEFTKMAVKPQYRNKGIGKRMMEHTLAFARQNNFKTIIIYTSSLLPNAIHIYEKYDFIHVEMEEDKPYARGDVKMKLEL